MVVPSVKTQLAVFRDVGVFSPRNPAAIVFCGCIVGRGWWTGDRAMLNPCGAAAATRG